MQRKGPLPGKIFALCIPERRFAALFGYMARISCQCRLISDTWRRYLAKEGRFSRPRALLGYMRREKCQGLPPGNASRENIATASRPRAHCRHALLCSSLRRMHRGRMLPCPTARGRTAASSCQLSRTSSCERVQDARSRHVSPEPIRGMRRCRRQRATQAAGLTAPRGH